MKNQALISVIIPVYNVERYLRECVDSVINQTYKNLDIILVDDGSTDSSGQICDEYAKRDDRITVIHKTNSGLSDARNNGLEIAKGKYVYFLDSDDYIAENAIETLFEIAERDNSDIVFFDAVSFADSNDFNVKQSYIRKNNYQSGNGYDVFSALIKNDEFRSAVPLLFLKRDFLKNIGLCFIPDILYEDMIFTYQAFGAATAVSQCTEAFYHRRYRQNSIMTSSKNKKHFISIIAVCLNNFDFTSKINKKEDAAAKKYLSRCAFNVFNIYEKLNTCDKKEYKEELKKFKKNILANDAFNNTALKMRCYGKAFWFLYKIFNKTAGKLLKGIK